MLNRQAPKSLEDLEAWARHCGHYQILEGLERYHKFKGKDEEHEADGTVVSVGHVQRAGTG